MSEMVNIVLKARDERGKEQCKKMRPENTPCVFYGPKYVESIPCTVKTAEVAKLLSARWETQTLNATLPDGQEEMCLIRDFQRDPVSRQLLHVDFLQLVKGHKINVRVPVELTGRDKCPGVKAGGIVEHLLREVEMEVLPSEIPPFLSVDVSELDIGEHVYVRDLPIPEGAEVLTDLDEIVVSVIVPRSVVESEAEEVEEDEAKEVEVVAKGKAKSDEEAE
jgi:large subunit ribosomal protein L25